MSSTKSREGSVRGKLNH